ncbi:hypothetical protein AB0B38_22080 [Streptomyces eurythermus]
MAFSPGMGGVPASGGFDRRCGREHAQQGAAQADHADAVLDRVGDDAGVAGVGLALGAVAVGGPVHRTAGDVEGCQAVMVALPAAAVPAHIRLIVLVTRAPAGRSCHG